MAEGVDYCGPAKISHKGFGLAAFKNLTEYWTGRLYIFIKGNPRVSVGIPLINIGNKYNSKEVLGFIDTEGAVSTEPVHTYLSHFPDIYSNVSVHPVVRLHLLDRYFNDCNVIDNRNRMWQSDLVL